MKVPSYRTAGVKLAGLALATLGTAQLAHGLTPASYPSFELTHASRVTDVLLDAKAALSADTAQRVRHWSPVLGGAGAPHGPLPGIVDVSVTPWDWADDTVAGASVQFQFKNDEEAEQFRQHLISTVGAPDAACTDALRAHWAVAPGQSLMWRQQAEPAGVVQLMLMQADAPDANCAVHDVGPYAKLQPQAVRRFLDAIAADPLPWQDAKALKTWMAGYGKVIAHGPDACPAYLEVELPAGLPGVDMMALESPACDDAATRTPPALHLMAGSADMYAADALWHLLRERHGEPQAGCLTRDSAAWAVNADTHASWLTMGPLAFLKMTYRTEGADPCGAEPPLFDEMPE